MVRLGLDCDEKAIYACLRFSWGPVYFLRNPQVQISAKLSLKLGPTVLFTLYTCVIRDMEL